jgi:hypothetical protein
MCQFGAWTASSKITTTNMVFGGLCIERSNCMCTSMENKYVTNVTMNSTWSVQLQQTCY